jgi:hypothetical protein
MLAVMDKRGVFIVFWWEAGKVILTATTPIFGMPQKTQAVKGQSRQISFFPFFPPRKAQEVRRHFSLFLAELTLPQAMLSILHFLNF